MQTLVSVINHISFTDFNEILDMIFSNKASVNFYMFHGGTNWGFMNGANVMDTIPFYAPDVSSYGMNNKISFLSNIKREIVYYHQVSYCLLAF